MSRFIKRKVSRFELGDGDWVDLLEEITFGQRQDIQNKLFRRGIGNVPVVDAEAKPATPKLGDAQPEEDLGLDTTAANIELLRIAIVEWGGPGFCAAAEHPHEGNCIPMPKTAETLADLDTTGEAILLELQRRMVKPKRDFSPTPSPDTATEAGAALTEIGSSS